MVDLTVHDKAGWPRGTRARPTLRFGSFKAWLQDAVALAAVGAFAWSALTWLHAMAAVAG